MKRVGLCGFLVLFSVTALAAEKFPDSVYFFNHIHSDYSTHTEWAATLGFKRKPKEIIQGARETLEKLGRTGVIAITDHNDDQSFEDLIRDGLVGRPGEPLVAIRGAEMGEPAESEKNKKHKKESHLGLIGFNPEGKLESYATLFQQQQVEAFATWGGIRIVNHPIYKGIGNWPYGLWGSADAVEVYNSVYEHLPAAFIADHIGDIKNDKAVEEWARALKVGKRYTAVAGTDFHHAFTLTEPDIHEGPMRGLPNWWRYMLFPANVVYAPTNDPEQVLEAVRRGRVSIKLRPRHPRLFIRVTPLGGGNPVEMGGSVSGSGKMRLDVLADFSEAVSKDHPSCESSRGLKPASAKSNYVFKVFRGMTRVAERGFRFDCQQARWSVEFDVSPKQRDLIRVEAHDRSAHQTMMGLTNPVYINY